MSLAELARLSPTGEGVYEGEFDASWSQGPGVYGGLVAAALGGALESVEPDRALRTLSIHLCAPVVPGPVQVVVTRERQGAATSFYRVEMRVEGKPAVIGTAMLSTNRVADADFEEAVMPAMRPPSSLPDLGTAPGVPVFTQHFDFRFTHGVPFQGAPTAKTGGWVRTRKPEPLSTSLALGLLDVWPLAVLPTFARPRPAASVAIHFQLLQPLADRPDDAWYGVAVESVACRGGYSDQLTSVWDETGRLLGRCQQMVAVIR